MSEGEPPPPPPVAGSAAGLSVSVHRPVPPDTGGGDAVAAGRPVDGGAEPILDGTAGQPVAAAPRTTLRAALRRAHLAVALLAVTMAGLSLTAIGVLALRAHAEDNLTLLARSLTYTAEAAVVFGDRRAADEALALVATREDLGAARILDAAGRELSRWQASPAEGWRRVVEGIGRMSLPAPVEVPIVRDGATLGRVEVQGSGVALARFLLGGLAALFVCLAASALLALHFSRRMLTGITAALRRLAAVAHDVRRDPTLGRRAAQSGIVEIDDLGADVNALLDELEQRQHRLHEQNVSLAHLASHDSLTGLPNRAYFEQCLAAARRRAEEEGTRIAVLFLDGDHFKRINDEHGHASGDLVLATLAARVRARVRDGDVVARLGGDEFGVLLAPLRGVDDALGIADQIIGSMSAPVRLADGHEALLSFSVGVAVFPDHGGDESQLLRRADDAMYDAKRTRRGSRQLAPWPQGGDRRGRGE